MVFHRKNLCVLASPWTEREYIGVLLILCVCVCVRMLRFSPDVSELSLQVLIQFLNLGCFGMKLKPCKTQYGANMAATGIRFELWQSQNGLLFHLVAWWLEETVLLDSSWLKWTSRGSMEDGQQGSCSNTVFNVPLQHYERNILDLDGKSNVISLEN